MGSERERRRLDYVAARRARIRTGLSRGDGEVATWHLGPGLRWTE